MNGEVARHPLDLWVTGGGTREPIDDVRYIGNRSTGRLALAIAASALNRGHRVRLLIAADVPSPADHPALTVERFETAASLAGSLAGESSPDALVHAAAVADYAPDAAFDGKIASGQDRIELVLVRQPKVVDGFRRRHPGSHLTLFKLESGIEPDELFQRARRAARRAGAQQVFANLLDEVAEGSHGGWRIGADSAPERCEGREAIAAALLRAVEEARARGAAS